MTDKPDNGTETVQPRGHAAAGSAAAARRARRIGGRPAPAPAPEDDTVVADSKPKPQPGSRPVAMNKPVASAPTRPAPEPDAAATSTGAPTRPAPPAWLNWAPAAVLSAGALAMAVVLIVFSHGVWWGPDRAKPTTGSANVVREQVLAAAKTCVADTNTYKYTQLDAYETKALACTTGRFVDQLKNTIESLIKVNAPKLKSSQTAQINRGGIEAVSSSGTQWTVLLFGQLSVVNTTYPKGRTDPFAAQARMEKVGDKWLISDLTTVSTPLS